MRRTRRGLARKLQLIVATGVLFQLSSCLGGDPAFFLANTVATTVTANLIALAFSLLTGGATV